MASEEAIELANQVFHDWHAFPPENLPANVWTYMLLTEEEYHVWIINFTDLPDDFLARHEKKDLGDDTDLEPSLSFTIDENNFQYMSYKVWKKSNSAYLGQVRLFVSSVWIFDGHDFITLPEMIEIAEFMSNLPDLNVEEPQF